MFKLILSLFHCRRFVLFFYLLLYGHLFVGHVYDFLSIAILVVRDWRLV
jgi:hypothetical protein